MSQALQDALWGMNLALTIMFTIEFIMKQAGLGVRRYWREGGYNLHKLDGRRKRA